MRKTRKNQYAGTRLYSLEDTVGKTIKKTSSYDSDCMFIQFDDDTFIFARASCSDYQSNIKLDRNLYDCAAVDFGVMTREQEIENYKRHELRQARLKKRDYLRLRKEYEKKSNLEGTP